MRRYNALFSPASLVMGLDELLDECGVTVWLDTLITEPLMQGDRVSGVVVETKGGRGLLRAKCLVDATSDADIATGAGAEIYEDDNWLGYDVIESSFQASADALAHRDPFYLTHPNHLTRLSSLELVRVASHGPTEIHYRKSQPAGVEKLKVSSAESVTKFAMVGRRILREHYKALYAAGGEFTRQEWMALLMNTVGLNPEFYSHRQQLFILARLVPIAERMVHILELGPRETGKSYGYKNLSRQVKDPSSLIGQAGKFRVIKFDRKTENAVLSRKLVLQDEREKKKRRVFGRLAKGQTVAGRVKSLTKFRAFVDLGGIEGLLHVSDISWGRSTHPSEHLTVGQDLEVVVLDFSEKDEKISLGLKQLTPDPWANIAEKYQAGQKIAGKVSSLTDFGAFVELEKGVEGLVHISDLTWSRKLVHSSPGR